MTHLPPNQGLPDSGSPLPLPHEAHPLPPAPMQPGPVASPAAKSPAGNKRRGNLLVIDNDPLALIAVAGVLDAEGYACICARSAKAAEEAFSLDTIDAVVADVGNDAPAMLELLAKLRGLPTSRELPAVLIADQQWIGLQQRTETMSTPTRCLFKPIDPGSLLAVVEGLLWMPQIVASHRRRGTRPGRPGWVSL